MNNKPRSLSGAFFGFVVILAGLVLLGSGVRRWYINMSSRSQAGSLESPLPSTTTRASETPESATVPFTAADLARRREQALQRSGGALDLRTAARGWLSEDQTLINTIERETFAESLAASGAFLSNFSNIIADQQPLPQLPESLPRIVMSRRFAKMLEELRGVEGDANRRILHSQISFDLAQWRRLYDSGQRLYGDTIHVERRGMSTEELMVPLTYRLNMGLLLLSEEPRISTLSAAIAYADTLKEDANWALAGFAVSRTFDTLPADEFNGRRRETLATYLEMKETPELQKLIVGQPVILPSFRSVVRPGDRTAVMGAPVQQTDFPDVAVIMPPQYRVRVNVDKSQDIYSDTRHGTEANKRLVELGRQFPAQSN
jgi:hypothetical protein